MMRYEKKKNNFLKGDKNTEMGEAFQKNLFLFHQTQRTCAFTLKAGAILYCYGVLRSSIYLIVIDTRPLKVN